MLQLVTGSFNKLGSPIIELEASGPLGHRVKLTALVDTGFTGFLSVPILQAFPIGLILVSTTGITLADGSTHPRLTCLGEVHLGKETQMGLFIVEPTGTDVLVGMDLLKKFKKQLIVDPTNGVVRLDTTSGQVVQSQPASEKPSS